MSKRKQKEKQKRKQKRRFAVGLAVYAALLTLVIIAGLMLFWQYIAAYERSLADGAMDRYMANELMADIDREIDRFAAARQTPFESAQEIAAALRLAVVSGELTYRKDLREYTPEEPVYSVRLDKRELAKVCFRPYSGGALDFGFERWYVRRTEFDLDGFAQSYVVQVPTETAVEANGEPLTAANCSVTWEGPEELLPYSDQLAEMPLTAHYVLSTFSPVKITLPDGGENQQLSREENTFTVTPVCPPELSDQLYQYAEDFVRAYIAFTSNSAGPDIVIGYTVPGGPLYQRVYAALAGLSWVDGITGYLSELSLDGLRYYGSAATLEAHYGLTLGTMMNNQNNMKIILTQTQLGWRVAEVELF